MSNIKQQEKIIKVIEIFFPEAKIYLFGSRARGDFTVGSDIDIAIDAGVPMSLLDKAKIITMIDALGIPQKTDVVDFNRVPEALKANIIKEGVLWKSWLYS